MSATAEPHAIRLPETLPIFPLNGVLLLPRGRLPLQVFEPRYLNLVADALAGDRLIGIVQPRDPESDPAETAPTVFGVGCAGRIDEVEETDDGRFLITLIGISRFAIDAELEPMRGYRRVHADYARFGHDLLPDPGAVDDRARLLEAVRAYFGLKGIEADWEALESVGDEALVTAVSVICPVEPREKQALLECLDVAARARLLTSVLEFAVLGGETSPSTARH